MRVQVEEGTIIGPLLVESGFILNGVVTADVTVEPGGDLELNGAVSGGVVVRAGGRAEVNGTVAGDVANDGELIVRGVIVGHLEKGADASTTIERFAQVEGVTY